MKLTKTAIEGARCTAQKDAFVWCNELPRFGVRITPSGRKTFIARYRTLEGASRSITIGRTCDLSIPEARELARKVFASVASGRDPSAEKAELRGGARMADLYQRYDREHTQPYKKPSTRRKDETLWHVHILPRFGGRAVAAITSADLHSLHVSMRETPAAANRTLALLSSAFRFAKRVGWYQHDNPSTSVRRYKERQRDRVLSRGEVAAFLAELDRPERRFCASTRRLFKLLLLTGARLSEIRDARLEWIDYERRCLVLPDSKTGARRVALPSAAFELLAGLPSAGWLCPNHRRTQPIRTPYRSFVRICKAVGIEGARIHDIRHTVGSWAHAAGLSQREIADLLGHRNLGTTQRYIHAVHNSEIVVEKLFGTQKKEPQQMRENEKTVSLQER